MKRKEARKAVSICAARFYITGGGTMNARLAMDGAVLSRLTSPSATIFDRQIFVLSCLQNPSPQLKLIVAISIAASKNEMTIAIAMFK